MSKRIVRIKKEPLTLKPLSSQKQKSTEKKATGTSNFISAQ